MGYKVETHHHEVATGNQNEINLRFDSLLAKADEMMMFKYVIHNKFLIIFYCGAKHLKWMIGFN